MAAGLVPLALGTDTAGSVRNPASACGIVGLKPTRGLLPLAGVVPLAWSLDHVGILTRSISDMVLGFAALAPSAVAQPTPRIGYIRHFHEVDIPASPEVAATTQFLIQGALQQWLSDVITVATVEVEAQDGALLITVQYVERRTQTRGVAQISAPGGSS